jgi:hypothetical protein
MCDSGVLGAQAVAARNTASSQDGGRKKHAGAPLRTVKRSKKKRAPHVIGMQSTSGTHSVYMGLVVGAHGTG